MYPPLKFRDRMHAGELLASRLLAYAGRAEVTVVGLPRGGIPVAFQIARQLEVPLEVLIVRKLGFPGHRELAFGAIASNDVRILNPAIVQCIPPARVEEVIAAETREMERQEAIYRGQRTGLEVTGKVVILVDDGVATGASIKVAAEALRRSHPGKIVIAVPVIPTSTFSELESIADEVIALCVPDAFSSVGQWYDDFSQTTDEEVVRLLTISNPSS